MTTGMIIGRRRCCVLTQRPTTRRITCWNPCWSRVPVLRRLGERGDDLRQDVVEHRLVLGEAASLDLGPDDHATGLLVDGDEDRDEALLGEHTSVLEVGVGDLADRGAVDVHVSEVELADHLDVAVLQVEHDAVVPDDGRRLGDARLDGERGVRGEVPVLAVDRQHVARAQDVVAVQQFACGRVAAHVNLRVALVHHLRAELRQAVDDAVDRVLVAGDEARRQDDGVALPHLDLVLEVGHAREHRHRLALRPGAHVDDAVVGKIERLAQVHEHAVRDLEVPEVGGDAHVAHHAATHEGDPTAVGGRRIQHLLHPVHVAGEAGDDDATRGLGDDALEHRADVALERGESGDVGVGRVGHEQVDTLFAEPRERAQVGDAVVERELVHLEVAGVQHQAGGGADRDGERVGNGVVDGDELEVERAQRLALALPARSSTWA